MKKQLLLVSAIAFASIGANGQDYYDFGSAKPAKMYDKKVENINHITTNYKNSYNVIWGEDFEDASAPSGTGIFDTGNGEYTFDGDDEYWEFSSDANWPINANVQVEMNGTYMLWDSYSPHNDATGNTETNGFSTTPVNGAIRTPSIDLSSATDDDLVLSFITATMFCCHPNEFPYEISVSIDGGTTFGDPMVIDFGVPRNDGTWNISSPLEFSIDLQSELDADPANNNDVIIEFRWVGDEIVNYPSGNFQYNTMYFWALDDLMVYEKPDHDLQLDWAWTTDITFASDISFESSEIPQNLAGNFTASAKINNLGKNIPTNIALQLEVVDGSGATVASEVGGNLVNGLSTDTDTIVFESSMDVSQWDIGSYNIEYTVVFDETDMNETNNSSSRLFSVTDNVLAQYNANLSYSASSPGFFFSPQEGSSTPYGIGNFYTFDQDVELHGVEFSLHPGLQNDPTNTDQGEVELYVYEYIDQQNVEFVAGPFGYEVTQDKIKTGPDVFNNRHLYNLHQPEVDLGGVAGSVTLEAGKLYLVAFRHLGGPDNHLFYWGSIFDHDLSTRMFGPFTESGDSFWFPFEEEPVMALSFDETLNVDDNNLADNSIKFYPNPASETATIEYKLNGSSDVSIEIQDVTGKVVKTISEGQKTQGKHKVELSTSDLANGVYNYSVITDNTRYTKKFIKK